MFLFIGVAFVIATVFAHIIGVMAVKMLQVKKGPDSEIMDTIQYFFGSLLAQGKHE